MYGRWGGWDDRGKQLSVLELVKAGNLDLRVASLLWLMMEQRASVIVAAGPSHAGKTTTFNVMLDFLRPEVNRIELQGNYEDFAFLKTAKPVNSYLVAEEFSNWGMYVWGETAVRAFDLRSKGFALGGTIHALTARDVVEIFHRYLGLKVAALTEIDAIVTLSVTASRLYNVEPVRRINAVTLVLPHEKGIALDEIVSLGTDGNSFDMPDEADLQTALAAKFGLKKGYVVAEMKGREKLLEGLLDEGKISRDEVREAVVGFYRSNPKL